MIYYEAEKLALYGLSDATREYLAAQGLPEGNVLEVTFSTGIELLTTDHAGYVVIGDDYGSRFGILPNTDAVYALSKEDHNFTRFVNAGVEQLVKSWAAFAEYQQQVSAEGVDDDAGDNLAEQLEFNLETIDSKALANEESFWAVIVEQAKEGLI